MYRNYLSAIISVHIDLISKASNPGHGGNEDGEEGEGDDDDFVLIEESLKLLSNLTTDDLFSLSNSLKWCMVKIGGEESKGDTCLVKRTSGKTHCPGLIDQSLSL